MKKILILGSTGSIGLNALKVIEGRPDEYAVVGLAAGRNVDLLLRQIERFRPKAVALQEKEGAAAVAERLSGNHKPEVYFGPEGFKRLALWDEPDTVVSAMAGSAGFLPTYTAIEAGKRIALANKETMVMAGSLVMDCAKRRGTSILPVDSEHNAIFQSLVGHPREDLRRVIITASGGPFREMSLEEMASVTPESALKHPNWKMGRKITIDSATLMNKGLEAIEARWLFDLRIDQISILIHPQSIVHSMVEYKDGSIIAQMGVPDMMTPISYALSFPRHFETFLPPLKLDEVGPLSFSKPDQTKFKCLGLAFRAVEIGGSMPAVLNAANEVAVDLFLERRIGFLQIPVLVEQVMEAHRPHPIDSPETVMEADGWAKRSAMAFAAEMDR
ncbi:MAG: 1-deoxy-D-xylulose-5-phosphate reductoisomerase [Deltaproteobacteria bacterium HGW-Deltaproteobacteria-21]|nr:MAG: 1-deoxy-D-xylulose-5-phosphate reductoisomerase [Deltaproteobacteria bacterium HGW-Deltaproteobacteria-21]